MVAITGTVEDMDATIGYNITVEFDEDSAWDGDVVIVHPDLGFADLPDLYLKSVVGVGLGYAGALG